MRALLAALLLAAAPAAALEPLKPGATVAFFGFHLIDTSTEGAYNGVRADETARVELIEADVAARLAAEGFVLADLAPVTETLDRVMDPADCNGCELKMARALGADYALVGQVQKVSNLILAVNLYLREAETGRQVRGRAVDIRGNTDDSWLRGARYILRHEFFPAE